jgi:hypothetical protein
VSVFLEEGVQIRERSRPLLCSSTARAAARLEAVATVGPFGVADALGARFPTLVIGAGIVELAVVADVQVGAAAFAGVAEADPLGRSQLDRRVAACTAHAHERVTSAQPCQGSDRRRGPGRAERRTARLLGALAGSLPGLFLLLLLADSAHAQTKSISVNDLAVDWARGRFASPVVCIFDGEPTRGMRRVAISAGPTHARPRVARVQFKDIEADEATRCTSDLGHSVSNVRGTVEIHLAATQPRDTAMRDFKSELRRNHGFEYVISSGRLRFDPIGEAPGKTQTVDFQGGTAGLFEIRPGSDAGRLLADFSSPRRVLLTLQAKDGKRLEIPLFMTDFR